MFSGYGTFTERDRSQDEFLLEYKGELINSSVAQRRIATGASDSSFMFFLNFQRKNIGKLV